MAHAVVLSALAATAGCSSGSTPPLARAWPELGTMMSVAAWGRDTLRVARALAAAHDSVDRLDSLLQHRGTIPALDSMRRELRARTGVTVPVDSIARGYALDRAALALRGVADSALLDLGGQYLWIGRGRETARPVGIADPDNSLNVLATVELHVGSIHTRARAPGRTGAGTRWVSVLAPDGLTANGWAAALFVVGCDRALTSGAGRHLSVACADSAGVRWTTDLQNRIALPTAPAP